MMNCDQVFELLTQVPASPSGRSTPAGERQALAIHLLRCAECRALEQQLSPALGLLALSQAECRDLPEIDLTEGIAVRHAEMPEVVSQRGRQNSPAAKSPLFFNVLPPQGWWRLAAALALGFVLAAMVNALPPGPQTGQDRWLAAVDAERAYFGPFEAGASSPLPGATAVRSCGHTWPLGLTGQHLCCTTCHRAGNPTGLQAVAQAENIGQLLASCAVCHTH